MLSLSLGRKNFLGPPGIAGKVAHPLPHGRLTMATGIRAFPSASSSDCSHSFMGLSYKSLFLHLVIILLTMKNSHEERGNEARTRPSLG